MLNFTSSQERSCSALQFLVIEPVTRRQKCGYGLCDSGCCHSASPYTPLREPHNYPPPIYPPLDPPSDMPGDPDDPSRHPGDHPYDPRDPYRFPMDHSVPPSRRKSKTYGSVASALEGYFLSIGSQSIKMGSKKVDSAPQIVKFNQMGSKKALFVHGMKSLCM